LNIFQAMRAPTPCRHWALLVLLAFVAITTTALGSWQIQRLGWKKALIARVETRVHAGPVPPPEDTWTALERDRHEYLRVRLTGTFRHDLEIPVYASTIRGPGYWIMTPLVTERGVIWVNRGFVDSAHRDPATRPHDHGDQPVEITGLIRMPEHAGVFGRANVLSEQRWYVRTPQELSAARGILPSSAPWFLDQDSETANTPWPIPGMTVIQFRNQHFSYALTWFTLAGLSVYGWILVMRHPRRAASPAPRAAP